MKQLMAGGGVALIGITLVPLLSRSVRLSTSSNKLKRKQSLIHRLGRKSPVQPHFKNRRKQPMAFFNSAITVLQTLVVALELVLASGEQSTFWRVTETIIPVPSRRG